MYGGNWLITGGTGTLGNALVQHLEGKVDRIGVLSRDELKQWEMRSKFPNLDYFVADVRDRDTLRRIERTQHYDVVIHAAALKHVYTGERYPSQVFKTNTQGTENVLDTWRHNSHVVLVSTDKAVMPVNAYGASKMLAEKMVLAAGHTVVRYGNVFGSRGSVLHVFNRVAAESGVYKVHHAECTRFMVSIDRACEIVIWAALRKPGLLIPELRAFRIVDLARAFDPDAEIRVTQLDPGEKVHEVLSLDPWRESKDAEMLTIGELRSMIDATI